ncbi:hypothetical protein [Nocardioides campestrisoli]|uniref:hypothetical protein n=1 Tax=Nocardioides campestrisoli TaxID=2736757 RepID=UPI00163D65C8|nr:hypothetical protein [Nocardioides campestrisoli]
MTVPTTLVLTGAAVLAVVVLALVLALVRLHRQTRAALERAEADQAALRARLDELAHTAHRTSERLEAEFVITDAGNSLEDARRAPEPARIEGRLFADLVLRESAVKAASWAYAVRRVASAESRNRLRFEMRQETKRSTRRRRADVKEALRQYYARERGDLA